MKRKTLSGEIVSRIIAIAIVAGGIFVLSSAATYAQVSPCQAKANYDTAKQAAETAQQEFNKYKLPGSGDKTIVTDPTDKNEKMPEQKLEDAKTYLKSLIGELKQELSITDREEKRNRLKKKIASLSQTLRGTELWLNARKQRDEAERKLALSKAAYLKTIIAKDSALKNARATFDNEQAHIQRVRASLDGRPQDAAYIRDVTLLLTRTRATYERLLSYLSQYDCFVDVRNFMDGLKPRLKKIDANMEIVRNASAAKPSSTGYSSPASRPPISTPSPAGSLRLVGTEMTRKNRKEAYNATVYTEYLYTATSATRKNYGDYGNFDILHWDFNGIPGSLRPGQEFTVTITGSLQINQGRDLQPNASAGVEVEGLEVVSQQHAFVGALKKREGKYVFRVPQQGATKAKIAIWGDYGISTFAVYRYEK